MIGKLLARIAQIGADPQDDESRRLQKALLVICAFPFMVAGMFWGLMYFLFGEPLAGAIPLSYSVVSLLSIIHFGFTRRFEFFRFSQLGLILLLPFLLMETLGGFVNGSAVILWGLICPLGALLFDKPEGARHWFVAYVSLIILSSLFQPYLRPGNNLSAAMVQFFFVINLLGVSSLVFLMVAYFVQQKNMYQEKSETLLLNILPREIAAILKNENRTIADHVDGASILFADMVNFTPLSASMPPVEMVDLLNEVFSYFDELVERYGVEKIRTIGDSYMVAAGVPTPRPDHAQVLAHMALDMRAYLQSHVFKDGRQLDFRIGLNSGPVVAGVIGRKKFIYDLWGDAVNTASRMESHGSAGRIQITRATYELIKAEFDCELRGTIPVKGKGEMEVWYVTGVKNV